MGWDATYGLGCNIWAGMQHMGWDATYGLGCNIWAGMQHMGWDATYGLGCNIWAGIMDGKNNGIATLKSITLTGACGYQKKKKVCSE